MSDELEHRLRRIDPVPPTAPVDPPDSPSAVALMRSIMDTATTTPTPTPAGDAGRDRRWVRPLLAAAAAAVVVAGGWIAIDAARGDDEPTVASYELAAGDPMMMCLAIDEIVPDPSAEAFGGTVTSVADGVVTIEVDRWYTPGDADVVELRAGTDVPVALDGVEFVAGQRYLVTTFRGEVSICGMSGPATPELEQVYARWYGG